MSRLRLNKIATPATPATSKGELYYSSTLEPDQLAWIDEGGQIARIGGSWAGAATGAVGGGFAADTYMTGTKIDTGTIGCWKAGMVYEAKFDMAKTGAGIATPIIIVRMGTAGTTADAAVLTLTHAAGTANADTGIFTVTIEFRSVGSGTSAVIAGASSVARNSTTLTQGLVNNNNGVVTAASSGFNSTTSNIIGVSFNGGASFVGTNIWSCATLQS